MTKPAKDLDNINQQLADLDNVADKSSEIVKNGHYIMKNNSVEDKDDSISGIKRVEETLETAITEAAKLATDSDLPKGYECLAKLIKEYGALQQVKMNIHKDYSTPNDPNNSNGDTPNEHNTTVPTSMKTILESLKAIDEEAEAKKDDGT